MQFLRNLPIRRKLMVITMFVSGIAVSVACAAFMVFQQAAARREMVETLSTTAAMTAANSAAGLSFDDAASVEQALKSLGAQADIVEACVYDHSGRPFARFVREDAQTNSPPPVPGLPGAHFEHRQLELVQPITLAGEEIGKILIDEDLGRLNAARWHDFLICSVVFLLSAVIAFFLTASVRNLISQSLADLARTVGVIRAEKNYSVRAPRPIDHELAGLIDGFNEMLAQIEERDRNLERRVAERTQALAESLSVLNATLDSTADGIMVLNRDAKRVFQNRRTAELWQIPPAIAQGNDDSAQLRHAQSMTVEPDAFSRHAERFYEDPNARGQDEVELKNGTILERTTAPVVDNTGRNHGRIWTFRDVTERRKYEAALRESQSRFKFIFESVPVGITSRMTHPDGRIAREVNGAYLRICGLTAEQCDLPETPAKLAHPDDAAREEEFLRQVHAGERQQFTMEKRIRRPDGTVAWVAFSYQLQRYANGGFEELSTLVDITESKRAEQALRDSESKYYSLVDQVPAGIFRKDKDGRYVFVNSSFCRIKGVKPEHFLGKLPTEVIMPGELPAHLPSHSELQTLGARHHAEIMQTGRTIEFEEQSIGADGKLMFLNTVKSPVYDASGAVIGSQGILMDITQRKLAEAELEYERDLLRTLMENSTDHIYFKDLQSKFIKTSRAQARGFGLTSADEMVGKTDFDFFSEDHAQPAFDDEQEIIRTGRPIINKVERESWKDGRAECWALTTKMPLRTKTGKIIGTFGISKDITAIKETEAALAYERDLLKALLDQSPDSIFFKDRQSRYVKLSASEVRNLFQIATARHQVATKSSGGTERPAHLADPERFGEWVIGKSDADIYDPERAKEFSQDEQAIIQTGKPLTGKVEATARPDGELVWFMTTKAPWHNQAGEIIGTFGTARNITDLKQAEAKIEKVHQQLLETSRQAGMAEVATSVLHNVGNVLNSVNVSTTLVLDLLKRSRLGNLGRLAAMIQEQQADLGKFFTSDPRGKQLPDYLSKLAAHLATEQTEMVNEIELTRKNVEHIKDIVTMQQNYAKVSGVVEKVRATDLVEDALRMNAAALNRHEVEVIRDFPAEPVECNLERQKVLQILVNLIRNAKYACDESGRADKRLTVQVRQTADRAQISVLDNGVGIPAENMTRIFNHGFTTRENGHGFGLHSGALAAKELGGSLSAHSDGPGLGARFVLELPLQPPGK
jgi:PAS domain S-box-containing protein